MDIKDLISVQTNFLCFLRFVRPIMECVQYFESTRLSRISVLTKTLRVRVSIYTILIIIFIKFFYLITFLRPNLLNLLIFLQKSGFFSKNLGLNEILYCLEVIWSFDRLTQNDLIETPLSLERSFFIKKINLFV